MAVHAVAVVDPSSGGEVLLVDFHPRWSPAFEHVEVIPVQLERGRRLGVDRPGFEGRVELRPHAFVGEPAEQQRNCRQDRKSRYREPTLAQQRNQGSEELRDILVLTMDLNSLRARCDVGYERRESFQC